MQRLEDFRLFYNHTIHPELMRMEKKRKRLLLLLFFSILLFISIIILEIYLDVLALTLFFMVPIGFYASYLLIQIKRFVDAFKPGVVDLVLDFIDDGPNFGDLKYDSKGLIPKQRFLDSRIFATKAPEYKGEDFIFGKIGELDFELCELNVRESSRVQAKMESVFRGVFLHAKTNIPTQGAIIVWPREFKQYLTRSIKAFTAKGGDNIDESLEVESFRELFTTYATPDASIFKTLNYEMQVELANYTITTGKEIFASFIGDDIYVGISEPKDILEPYIFRSNVSFDLVKEFFEDLQMLFSIVDTFDSNN